MTEWFEQGTNWQKSIYINLKTKANFSKVLAKLQMWNYASDPIPTCFFLVFFKLQNSIYKASEEHKSILIPPSPILTHQS